MVRLTIANGMRDIGHLLRSTPHYRRVSRLNRELTIELASRLSGFDAEEIAAATPKRITFRSVHFKGELFGQTAPVPGRLCPICVDGDLEAQCDEPLKLKAFRRGWWQIPPITTCPKHETILVSSCGRCGGNLDENLPVTMCKCGSVVLSGQKIDASSCAHDAWLLGRLGVQPARDSHFLDGMPLGTAALLCRVVGKALVEKASLGAACPEPEFSAEMRTAGWHLLAEGLGGLEWLLDELVARERAKGHYRHTSYAGLRLFLRTNDCTSLDAIRDLLTAHAGKNPSLTKSSFPLFDQVQLSGDRILVTRAASYIGVSESRLLSLLASIDPGSSAMAEDTKLLDWSTFVSIRDALKNSIRSSEAMVLLGFNDRLFRAASDADLFDFLLPVSWHFDLVRRGSVDALLRTFTRPPVVIKDGLLDPTAFARIAKVSVANVMIAVGSKQLLPTGRRADLNGFPGLLFSSADISQMSSIDLGKVEKRRAMKELGWLNRTMAALRAEGLLVGGRRMVSFKAIAKFRADYVAPNEAYLWLAAPTSFISFCVMLQRECGQPVVAGPGVTPFWNRHQLAATLRPKMKDDANIHAIGFGIPV